MKAPMRLGGSIGWCILGGVAILLAMVLGSRTHPQVGRADSSSDAEYIVVVSSTPVDFGEVPILAKLEREVVLRNQSNQLVGLEVVMVSCGCLVPQLERSSLKPGEETTFILRSQVQAEQGQQHYRAVLAAKPEGMNGDTSTPQQIVVDIMYRAAQDYFVFPRHTVIHQDVGSRGEGRITLRPQHNDVIRIEKIETDLGDAVVFEQSPIDTEYGMGVVVRIRTLFDDPGLRLGTIRIHTNSESQPMVTIPAEVLVRDPVVPKRVTVVLNGTNGDRSVSETAVLNELDANILARLKSGRLAITPMTSGIKASIHRVNSKPTLLVSVDFRTVSEPTGMVSILALMPDGTSWELGSAVWIGPLEKLARIE